MHADRECAWTWPISLLDKDCTLCAEVLSPSKRKSYQHFRKQECFFHGEMSWECCPDANHNQTKISTVTHKLPVHLPPTKGSAKHQISDYRKERLAKHDPTRNKREFKVKAFFNVASMQCSGCGRTICRQCITGILQHMEDYPMEPFVRVAKAFIHLPPCRHGKLQYLLLDPCLSPCCEHKWLSHHFPNDCLTNMVSSDNVHCFFFF
jgi:hypothetical protein